MRSSRRALVITTLIACSCTFDPPADAGWSLVILPDTQYYARGYPETFVAQTRWIREQRDALGIEIVLHVGDIVDDNGAAQWEVARAAFDELEGAVPYVLAPGNHDCGPGGSASSRDTLLNDYFPVDAAMARPGFGGLFADDRLDNSWHLFETPSGPRLVIALEFGPRDEVVAWADTVLTAHPDISTILITHAYLYFDDTRYDRASRPDQSWSPYAYGVASLPGGVNDGEDLFQSLVRRHDQIDFVFCGHVLNDGVARLTSTQDEGGIVHQLLANYQVRELGGEGYLRILDFHEDRVEVRTYSPSLDRYLPNEPGAENVLTLPLP